MNDRTAIKHTYANLLMDSSRWAGFMPRDGDVIVCTSYKAGTTWTQMICALLIHQTADLPASLGKLSPWLDMLLDPIGKILDQLEAQPHRRIIKTHTAMDGLPYFDNVTYVYCGRDPRDVFMSMQNHLANGDMVQIGKILTAQGIEFAEPPPLPDDIDDRFSLWMNVGTFDWEQDGLPYWSHFHHAETFWAHRHRPNVHFLHYADMKADLEGEMRRLARALAIEVDEARWPGLVKAATFDDMKANAERTTPAAHHNLWVSNSQFFNKGENAQWRGALSEQSLRLYDQLTRSRYPVDLVDWLERGSAAASGPKP